MAERERMPEAPTGFHVEGLTGLSRNAASFLRRHPKQARMAVTAALEAAAVQFRADMDEGGDEAGIPVALRPFVERHRPGAGLLNVSQAAGQLRVSRTTIYDWVERKTLLGWKSTKRGLAIPAEQILGPGKVVPGVPELCRIIRDPELAWAFLSEVWPFADEAARPIDKLKAGAVNDVIGAAPGFGTAFT